MGSLKIFLIATSMVSLQVFGSDFYMRLFDRENRSVFSLEKTTGFLKMTEGKKSQIVKINKCHSDLLNFYMTKMASAPQNCPKSNWLGSIELSVGLDTNSNRKIKEKLNWCSDNKVTVIEMASTLSRCPH